MGNFTIAVVSDLHAHEIDPLKGKAPSTYSILGPRDSATQHPIAGLKQLITGNEIHADVLLCGGDITDRANPKTLAEAWNDLQDIKNLLCAKHLVATAGNHDTDSRYIYNDHDAKGMLQALKPMFPGIPEDKCDRYWSRNFTLLEGDNWRILSLNSAAYHGGGKNPDQEAEHGRISRSTVESIRRELSRSPVVPVNVLLCHHHLVRDTIFAESDYSEMVGADHLLQLLGCGEFGSWLVVHGHKHHPRLFYAPGDVSPPVIFAAGSLCAHLYAELQTRARNQFYICQFPIGRFSTLGLDLAGRITAWDWIHLSGWQPASKQSGLPYRSGFGHRPEMIKLTLEVARHVKEASPWLSWNDLLVKIPQLEFALPTQVANLLERLKQNHNVQATFDEFGDIHQLAIAP